MNILSPIKTVRSGFTLLEMLLAIAICAVVLVAINAVFFGALRLRNRAAQSIEEDLPMQQALRIMKRDLQGIVPPGGTLAGPFQTATAGGAMGQPPGSTGFHTCTGVIDETSPFSDIQKVAYYLKPAVEQTIGQDLVRAVTRNLLSSVQEQPVEQWIMGGVQRMQMSYFDGASWRDTWDSTTPDLTTGATNLVPKAIKVQIEMAVANGQPRRTPVELLVPIVMQGRTNQTQSSSGGQQQ
ncbi:MAG TPA: type II secretion system protein GspJ [Verrucomicrobiae bacterium]|jgi:general secretion pathway protein J